MSPIRCFRGLEFFILLASVVSACGSADDEMKATTGPSSPTTADKTQLVQPKGGRSYSPGRDFPGSTLPSKLLWTYKLAGGATVPQKIDGGQLTYQFTSLTVELDRDKRKKVTNNTAKIGGTSSGLAVTGNFSNRIVETLMFGESSTTVDTTRNVMHMDFKLDGENFSIDSDIEVKSSKPLLWFPDHEGLSDLAVGFEQSQGDFMLEFEGTATANLSGDTNTERLREVGAGFETWTVRAKLPELEVLGRRYGDVVKLTRSGSTTLGMTGMMTESMATLWFARGVGLVRAEVPLEGFNQPLLWELESSNLM